MDRDTLIQEHLGLCKREARRWRHMSGLDQEDLVADGMVGLVKAAYRFDKRRGVPFVAFARPFIRGAILDTVRTWVRRNTLREGGYANVIPISNLYENIVNGRIGGRDMEYEVPDPGSTLEQRFEQLEALRLIQGLPTKERHVLLRTGVDGALADDVADELGVSVTRVYALVHSGATRLRRRAAA